MLKWIKKQIGAWKFRRFQKWATDFSGRTGLPYLGIMQLGGYKIKKGTK